MSTHSGKKFERADLLRLLLILLLVICLVMAVYLLSAKSARTAELANSPAPETEIVDASHALSVYFIDVGQGDAILLVSPNGRTMLVDAGPADRFGVLYNLMKELNLRSLDAVVATHAHDDHIGGMRRVIETYEIGSFYMSNVPADSQTYLDMLEALKAKGVSPKTALATANSKLGWDADVTVSILSPFDVSYEDANESGVVLRIAYGNTSVLLAADAGALAERMMMKALPNTMLDSDVLKVGHHGSYSSTTEKFLHAVSPGLGIVSCGRDNAFGHPDEKIVALFEENGIPLLSTADYGTIHVLLDGRNVEVVE